MVNHISGKESLSAVDIIFSFCSVRGATDIKKEKVPHDINWRSYLMGSVIHLISSAMFA